MILRPSVTEVLLGMKRVLSEVVLPDLTTTYVKARVAAPMVNALETLAHYWDKVLPCLMEENDELRQLFGYALPILQDAETDEHPLAGLVKLNQQLASELQVEIPQSKYPAYPALAETNQRRNALLCQIIEVVATLEDSGKNQAKLQELHQHIRLHLRKCLDREKALSPPQP